MRSYNSRNHTMPKEILTPTMNIIHVLEGERISTPKTYLNCMSTNKSPVIDIIRLLYIKDL